MAKAEQEGVSKRLKILHLILSHFTFYNLSSNKIVCFSKSLCPNLVTYQTSKSFRIALFIAIIPMKLMQRQILYTIFVLKKFLILVHNHLPQLFDSCRCDVFNSQCFVYVVYIYILQCYVQCIVYILPMVHHVTTANLS